MTGTLPIDSEQQIPADSDRYPSDAKDPKHTVESDSEDSSDGHVQHGVKQVEAVTMAWTKKSLATAYILYVLLMKTALIADPNQITACGSYISSTASTHRSRPT